MIPTARRFLPPALLLPLLFSRPGFPPAAALAQENLESVEDSQPDNSEMSTLKIFNQVVLLVKDNYVDPKRIHPKEMMTAALDYVQREVADVIVDPDKATGHVRVTVGAASKEFDVSDVDTLWKLSFRLRDIFAFMQQHLSKTDKPEDIETAAVEGMLSTLDPHSVYLPKDAYNEMRLQTHGEFGGLGFVITMKEGVLTVVKVLKGTPAARAGIKAKDRVIKIEEQSTVNMDLDAAVQKLRGKPGTKVAITVSRVGWPEPHRLELTREEIKIESVTYSLLESDYPRPDGRPGKSYLGGIKIKSFQGNTTRDLRVAIADLRRAAEAKGGTLDGIVLDLRGDPGGLLDQAIQVTNTFVDHGTIVTTVGYSDRLREEKKARGGPAIEKDMPLAVLVDNNSASASEIVSGALKNLDRAVIIGRPTFGKGSVQVLYDFPSEETALKLTIAQYLTPGDVSIQEVGIIPDIELDPARVEKDRIQVFAPQRLVGEADLAHHFGNPDNHAAFKKRADVVEKEKPSETVEYLRPPKKKKKPGEEAASQEEPPDEDEPDDVDDDAFQTDFQVRFARDLLVAAPDTTRRAMLAAARPYVEKVRVDQQADIDKAIEGLGIDWASCAAGGEAHPQVAVRTTPVPGEAGQKLDVAVSVENRGTAPLCRLEGYTQSDNPWLDRLEFVFGLVPPGQKAVWRVPVTLPKDMISRRDPVTLHFTEEHGRAPADQKAEIAIAGLPRPAFAFTTEAFTPHGIEDGMAHVGTNLTVAVDVKNEGPGRAYSCFASLKDLGDAKIFIKKGREKIGRLEPGETHAVTFALRLLDGYQGGPLPLRVTVVDDKLDEIATEKILVPVAAAGEEIQPGREAVRVVKAGAALLASAVAGSPPVATVRKGQVVEATARVGGFWAVPFGKGHAGFLARSDGEEVHAQATAVPVEIWQHEPPRIEIAGLDAAQGGPVTDADHFELTASIRDPRPLRDAYIFVNDRKVFFRAADPGAERMQIAQDVPLKAGNNVVTVVAREDDNYQSRQSFVVLRRSSELAADKPAPPERQ